jgi:hypothetical protein
MSVITRSYSFRSRNVIAVGTLAQDISSRCEVVHYPHANPTFRDGHHKADLRDGVSSVGGT